MFSITLPVVAPPSLAKPGRAHPTAATQQGGIVVIDDERDALDATALLLRTLGYAVYAGRSAAGARKELAKAARLGEVPVDLVITDYRLEAGKTGIDAIREIRAHLGREVPALILSGDTSPTRLKEVTASGHRLLHKPLDAVRLEEEIEALLAERAEDAAREIRTVTR